MRIAERDLAAIKVLSFDLDDTFWDCAPAIANAEQALYAWHQQFTPRIAQAHDSDSLADFRTEVRRRHEDLQGCVTAMRLQGLRELMAEFAYPEELADTAFQVFYTARSEVSLYPRVHELLQAARQRYQLAAITNGNADLARIGIDKYFGRVFAADLTFKAKPHRDMFDRCREHFGVLAHHVLHIGDNPVTDVQGGLSAGLQTLWFNQNAEQWQHGSLVPHYEVQNVCELIELLI